jgi:hypothetical protein
VSTEDRSGVGGSSDGQDEQSRIVLPPETGEQPSLSSHEKGQGNATLRGAQILYYFAADLDTRRSPTGYVIMMNGGPISWKSVKQKSDMCLSTAESEWYAASEAGRELLYHRKYRVLLTRVSPALPAL